MEYSIKKLSEIAGVSTRTLRYYDEIGLLKPARDSSSGYRRYGKKQVDILQQILFYKELGISLDEIKEIIRVSTHSYIVSSEEISNKVKSSTSGYEIKLDDLIEKGYISDEKLKNFETNKDINTKNVTIIVTYGLNDEGTAYEYQYQINGIK